MSEIAREVRELTPPQVITAMVTPFNRSETLDYEVAAELAEHLIDNGSDGLVLAGTTGESPALTMHEQVNLFHAVAHAIGSRATLIAGTGANTDAEAKQLTAEASRIDEIDQLLVVSPYYNRPSQYGIEHYYKAVAKATDRPVILYNIPVRTGRKVEFDTICRLRDADAIAGVKDATGDTNMAKQLIEHYGDDITIYSGDDGLNLDFLKAGAKGAISVASHWAGKAMQEQFAAFAQGDIRRAEKIGELLAPSCEFESVHNYSGRVIDTPNPIPAKVMMGHILGDQKIGRGRPPMIADPEDMFYLRYRASLILDLLNEEMQNLHSSQR